MKQFKFALILAILAGALGSTAVGQANTPPSLDHAIPDQTNTYGDVFGYTFPANTFSDPDIDQTLNYTATNLPSGITFDGSTHTFSGTNISAGLYDVTVTATDDGSPPLATNAIFTFVVAKAV